MADFKTKSGVIIAELSGVSQTIRALDGMRAMLTDAEVRAGYGGAAKGIADSVRRGAPVSRYPYASLLSSKRTSSRPGLLKKSIVGKAFSLSSWRLYGPGAFAQVTLRRGAANRAPHANIITPGRREIKPKLKRRLAFLGTGGRLIITKRAAAVPPNPFWRRGVAASQNRAIALMRAGIERAWNRRVNLGK